MTIGIGNGKFGSNVCLKIQHDIGFMFGMNSNMYIGQSKARRHIYYGKHELVVGINVCLTIQHDTRFMFDMNSNLYIGQSKAHRYTYSGST